MNPEFRRNLWLQLSWPRLLLTPVLLGVIFAVIGSALGRASVTNTAAGLFWAVTLLWGCRQAADSIGEEVAGGTWHGQRMSSLGAWPMTWGKLAGATAFSWYIALICLAVHQGSWEIAPAIPCSDRTVCPPPQICITPQECRAGYERFLSVPLWMVAVALTCQAMALAVALAALRRRPLSLRLPVTMAQGLGVLTLLLLTSLYDAALGRAESPLMLAVAGARKVQHQTVSWYGLDLDALTLGKALVVLALGLAIFVAYRLMQAALQYRTMPWGIVAGTVLVGAVLAGFTPHERAFAFWTGAAAPFFVACVAVYLGIFSDRIDPPRLRRLLQSLGQGRMTAAARLAPGGIAAFAFACLAGLGFTAAGGTAPVYLPFGVTMLPPPRLQPPGIAVAAMLLFVLRDIAVVFWFHLAGNARRADLAALVMLAVLHLLQPFVLDALGAGIALMKLGTVGAGLATVVFAGAEAAVAWALLAWPWRHTVATPSSRM